MLRHRYHYGREREQRLGITRQESAQQEGTVLSFRLRTDSKGQPHMGVCGPIVLRLRWNFTKKE